MTFVPVADMGAQLVQLLLWTLLWVLVAAGGVAAAVWWWATRTGTDAVRLRGALLGGQQALSGEPPVRRFLRVAFGLLWIVDGVLQAQPRMPAAFVNTTVEPGVLVGPDWFGSLVGPLARAWTRHPVAADVATVWIQVGLGLLLLLGGRGLLARVALWGTILWSLIVWVFGEAFGGLLASGASWLSGAPGSVLVYLAVSALLLMPWGWWQTGRAALITRRLCAAWLAFAAILQAVPGEGSWTAAGLSYHFVANESHTGQGPLGRAITAMASVSANHPTLVNATLIVVLTCAAVALWFSDASATIVLAVGLCLLTWWLAQDFGVLGGTATDPNTGLPLALLVAGSAPAWARRALPESFTVPESASMSESFTVPEPVTALAPVVAREPTGVLQSTVGHRQLRMGLTAGFAALALGLTLIVPALLAATLVGPADAASVTADSGGGIQPLAHRSAASFSLTDQRGQPVSTASLKGKLVVLTFLDPVCTSDCPLIANQMAIADRALGAPANRVEFIAVDSNPIFRYAADVSAFTHTHGLDDLPNWHFLYGPSNTIADLLAAYGMSVSVPSVGMMQHSEGMFFITADGLTASYLDDAAGEQLTEPYAARVRDEIRRLLK